MTRHVLTEYTPYEADLDRTVVNQLIERHGRHLAVEPTAGGTWRITPGPYVGTIVVADHSFLIRPKAGLHNLLAMMDVAVQSETWSDELVELAHDPDLLAVMARLFCVACEDTTRRGLRRSYVSLDDRLVAPRGRIDVGAIVRRPGLPSPVPCRFDEHSADIPLNQILRTAIEHVRRIPSLPPAWKRRLNTQLAELGEAETPLRDLNWVLRWDPAPMELHYETSVRLAHLLLTRTSLRDEYGPTSTSSFLINMNDLFEKWVLQQVRRALPGLEVDGQHPTSLGADGTIAIRPDIAILEDGRCIAAADTKYKLLGDDGAGRAPDYYQALAYATALRLDEVSLIYARWPDDPPGRSTPVRNSPVTLHTVGLDLTGSMTDVKSQVRQLAERIVARRLVSR